MVRIPKDQLSMKIYLSNFILSIIEDLMGNIRPVPYISKSRGAKKKGDSVLPKSQSIALTLGKDRAPFYFLSMFCKILATRQSCLVFPAWTNVEVSCSQAMGPPSPLPGPLPHPPIATILLTLPFHPFLNETLWKIITKVPFTKLNYYPFPIIDATVAQKSD